MKQKNIIQYSILLYLVVLLCILLTFDPLSLLTLAIPIALIFVGIYRDTVIPSTIGMSFLWLITLTRLPFLAENEWIYIYAYVLLVLVPMLLLLGQILQHHDITKVFQNTKRNRSSLFITIALCLLVLILFYCVGFIAGRYSFFSTESIQTQILLLVCFSVVIFLLLLLKPLKIPTQDTHESSKDI